MNWVLIYWLYAAGSATPTATGTAEFTTSPACLNALLKMREAAPRLHNVAGVCAYKGEARP